MSVNYSKFKQDLSLTLHQSGTYNFSLQISWIFAVFLLKFAYKPDVTRTKAGSCHLLTMHSYAVVELVHVDIS